jgi:DNA-binding beta-propeller fold protein YncE
MSYRVCVAAVAAIMSAPLPAQSVDRPMVPPDREYRAVVVSEGRDEIAFIRFGPSGAQVERTRTVGLNPLEPDGPHGVAVSPDNRFYYVSTAHGNPFGSLWKFDARADTLVGRIELGNFPATAQVSPDGYYVFVANFNFHGEMVPSSVSIVSTDPFVEVTRLTTCTMPHGSRFSPDGSKHYSACMMDDMLVEIDLRTMKVSRHFMLQKGTEHGSNGSPMNHSVAMRDDHGGHGMTAPPAGSTKCSATWAQPSADGSSVFVACNAANDIAEIDVRSWRLKRRIPAGDGVYNLGVTRDGRLLVATNKRGRSVSLIDIPTGRELATIATARKVVHGVAITPDDRYAFISVEGIGSEPGTVEIIDLRARTRVASVDVGQMAGGIDIMSAAR